MHPVADAAKEYGKELAKRLSSFVAKPHLILDGILTNVCYSLHAGRRPPQKTLGKTDTHTHTDRHTRRTVLLR